MNTLEDIKDIYYKELCYDYEMRGFNTYLKEEWVRVYDIHADFIGYERSSEHG